jgi:hypothetical protein
MPVVVLGDHPGGNDNGGPRRNLALEWRAGG